MADHYSQFSEEIECSGPEKEWLIEKLKEADENYPICQWESEPDGIWLYSEEHFGVDELCTLLCEWQKHFSLSKTIIIEWAFTCSQPLREEFGGGAFVCIGGKADWVNPREYAKLIGEVRLLEKAQEASNASVLKG